MKKYKFGDRVKLIKSSELDRMGRQTIGKTGVVVAKAYNGIYSVIFEQDINYPINEGFQYSTQFYTEDFLEQA